MGEEVGANIYIGGTSLDHSDAEVRKIKSTRLHPNYRSNNQGELNDFMLIKLDRPSSKPILPYNTNPNNPAEGTSVTAMGFGLTRDGGEVSDNLLEVNVRVDNFQTCDNGE